MHTVFINDQPLRFINVYNKNEIELAKGHQVYSENDKDISDLITQMENAGKPAEIFYIANDAEAAWKIFISNCTLIEAAGGLVLNENHEYLVILRNNKWDLPKGKIDYDETPEEAAMREIEEECGIDELSIDRTLPLTFHTYKQKEKRFLKKNHWYLMHTDSNSKPVPQKEEGIEEVKWFDQKTIQKKVLTNTYASIAELLKQHFGWS
jgi:8-oxo-dGTP pyrophosphatase MutT (NUDIX family)